MNNVEQQYTSEGLYERILHTLKEMGIDADKVTTKHLAAVDEFHVRGAAVSMELVSEMNRYPGMKVLDAGCGPGGTARMMASTYAIEVTGIDITEEYINTARNLSALTRLDHLVQFRHGNVLDLPFDNMQFDAVLTQHVQMNIENKKRFYAEIKRVLKQGGQFAYYDIFSATGGALQFPLPWANDASLNFLFTRHACHELLLELGYTQVHTRDQTAAALDFFENFFSRVAQQGLPPLGLHLLMGEAALLKLNHLWLALKEGKLELESGIYMPG